MNGVFESVLEEILKVQSVLPEQILFLQPYSSFAMSKLRDDPPSIASPMRLFISTTTDLANVHYQAEIVCWEDKRIMPDARKDIINPLIAALQPGDKGLYNAAKSGTGESVNLLHIRWLQKLDTSFTVAQLEKVRDGEPLSTARTQGGEWSYVKLEAPS